MSIKQHLYPAPHQVSMMFTHCDHARFIYNLGLEQRKMWHPHSKARFSFASQARELTEARKEFSWLAEGSAVIQQSALRDLDRAFQNWWKNPSHFGQPTWRKQGQKQGFIVRDLKVERLNRKWATVLIPKVGAVKFRLTRSWADVLTATSARVTFSPSGQWHVSLTTLPAPFGREATGSVIGLDRGVVQTVSTSNGTHANIPTLSEGEQARFLALERKLSQQVIGSNRREATKKSLNRLRDRLKNRRHDWVEKTTTTLVRKNDLIAMEALKIRNMVRKPAPKPDPVDATKFLRNGARAKAGLSRAIHASCWGFFAQRVRDKASMTPDLHRVQVIEVDPRNTSRKCYECGYTSKENRKSQAVFHCTKCDHTAHADTNASRNILARALETLPLDERLMGASATRECRAKPTRVA